ncbi:hypothetical protein [Streptomyces olivaceiscleroticus]|uniref:Histidine kinase n=1 Tax=Streptomyces olivaceiscleroticus TaxID=68245 RepID=A0ABN1BLP8_9ACTN
MRHRRGTTTTALVGRGLLAAGALLALAALAPLVGVVELYQMVRRRRIRAQLKRARIDQALREAHVVATALGIVSDAYALYGDLYDTPRQDRPDHVST